MTPYHHTHQARIHEGPAVLDALNAASVCGATAGIQVITGILLAHEIGTHCDTGDVLRLNNASVCGLLEAVSGLAELIELRLAEGATRAQRGTQKSC